ncbi:MAG: hypothetical protein COU08_03325 [Candidatus Harrisonbacteria bacterium CG10_big_fil_rev_8_21_14_0_10_42_17]|uniref:Amidohydrolase 3 domain-containing protein n=1 Tax=Candidatus Harrisonbacteria bacterium CG10_big_fil_rev_8_21_14_0_10_42_17 TaxID=1974584 RepID=A0A2M6WHQ2_9BACT|nr:MAG: hypothetical protein COU08_03325 [Candidatus Harrisonbacteria bacterium CG10_big_fil_rev_8_21_14_0_10_42_17]
MILIKDAQVIDGMGTMPKRSDILIKGDRISAVGTVHVKSAEHIVDAKGAYVAPGFIDVNTDSDHYLTLFTNPSHKNFLQQGITSIIGGQCGSSLAPLLDGKLDSIRKWADPNEINVDWQTVKEFLAFIKKQTLGVNFGTLIGHSTIRRTLIGDELRDLTENELTAFKQIVAEAMEEGALGISTGLGYAHAHETPYAEIHALAEIVKKYNGVYATHIRNETTGMITSIEETIKIASNTGIKTEILHFRPLKGFEKEYLLSLERIAEAAKEADITFDIYPFSTSIIPIYTLLPSWAKVGTLEVMIKNSKTPYVRERILKELPEIKDKDIMVIYAPGTNSFPGKWLEQIAADCECNLKEALLKLMEMTEMRAVVSVNNINEEVTIQTLSHPQAIISTNSPSLIDPPEFFKHDRAYATIPKFLSLVEKKNLMPIETAVQKITSIPAKKYAIQNRGVIKQGFYADLCIFKRGIISDVFVNGEHVVSGQEFQRIQAGRIIKRA